VLIGGLSLFSFTRTTGMVFLGNARSREAFQAKEVSYAMISPQFFLVIIMVVIGIFPEPIIKRVSTIAQPLLENVKIAEFSTTSITSIGLASLLFIILSVFMYVIRFWVVRKNGERYGPTWGCGYTGDASRLQYTASSFGDNMLQLFKPLMGRKETYSEIEETEIFPKDRPLSTRHDDVIEEKSIKPPLEYLSAWMVRFAKIQDGNTQHYIMYVFVFIVVITLLTLFNFI
jgi:hydrogenase-4 component B